MSQFFTLLVSFWKEDWSRRLSIDLIDFHQKIYRINQFKLSKISRVNTTQTVVKKILSRELLRKKRDRKKQIPLNFFSPVAFNI